MNLEKQNVVSQFLSTGAATLIDEPWLGSGRKTLKKAQNGMSLCVFYVNGI